MYTQQFAKIFTKIKKKFSLFLLRIPLRNSDRICFFFSFSLQNSILLRRRKAILQRRLELIQQLLNTIRLTGHDIEQFLLQQDEQERKRDKSARGLREEQRGEMVERERERDYEVVYSRKVVHNFTVGWLLKATEQRERERERGVFGDKSKEDKRSSRRRYFFPFLFCFFPSITKRYDVDRTRASRW